MSQQNEARIPEVRGNGFVIRVNPTEDSIVHCSVWCAIALRMHFDQIILEMKPCRYLEAKKDGMALMANMGIIKREDECCEEVAKRLCAVVTRKIERIKQQAV